MERTYNLSDVERVEVHERLDYWQLRGAPIQWPPHELVDFPHSPEGKLAACELAVEWCNQRHLTSYVVQTFTNRPYWFHLATIDVASGEVLKEHDAYYGS